LEELDREIESIWQRSRRWRVRPEVHRGGLEYRFYVVQDYLPTIKPEWGLRAGEIMFDLRSSLDHLMFQLWVHHFGGNVPLDIEEHSQFPLYDKPDTFTNSRNHFANLCRDVGVAFPDRDDERRWFRYWLGKLNTLHNFDKHRQLHVIAASQGGAVIPKFDPVCGGPKTEPIWGPVKPDGHVETWTFEKVPPNVQPHSGVMLQITLEYGGQWRELNVLLPALAKYVRHTLDLFADRFE
jgi:hypothetical protein